ncbi:MAG: twin-arginine translocase TatA/TatE family subunit [Anaerolineales bacterium]|jgi:sec-independent protein translocase protein TatA
MTFGIQPIHIVIIILVALLVFGPKRLPEIGRTIGKALNEFRNGTREVTDSLRAEVNGSGDSANTNNPAASRTTGPAPAPSFTIKTPSNVSAPAGNFCIHCGAANPPEALFCNQCGTKMPENTIKPSDPSILGQQD